MRTEIENVSSNILQEQLDQQFGPGVFTVYVDLEAYRFYIDCGDATDSSLVSQAVDIAKDESTRKFTEIRARLYDQIERMSQKTVDRYPNRPTEADVIAAENWLTDTNQPCPLPVTKKSILENMTPTQAAQTIVSLNAQYQTFLSNVESMKTQILSNILIKTNIPDLKQVATLGINYFNELEKDF